MEYYSFNLCTFSYVATCMNEDSVEGEDFAEQLSPSIKKKSFFFKSMFAFLEYGGLASSKS